MKFIKNFLLSNYGFTLVEVTIGLVVTSLLLITVSLIVNFSAKANLQARTTVSDIQEARRVLDIIVNEIKYCENYDSNEDIIIREEYNEDGDLLNKTLEYLDSDKIKSQIYLSKNDDIVYKETSSDKIPLSSGPYIKNINFEFDDNDETQNTIIISIQLEENSFSTTIRPLNPKLN